MSKIWWIVGGIGALVGGVFYLKKKHDEDIEKVTAALQGLDELKRREKAAPEGRAVT